MPRMILKYPACICGNRSYGRILKVKQAQIIRCKSCGLARTFPVPNPNYANYHCDFPESEESPQIAKRYYSIVSSQVRYFKKQGKLLDVGCSVGWGLECASQMGFESYGIEIDKQRAELANKPGLNVFCGQLEDAQHPDKEFDVIVANHVLEHILELNKFITESKRILKDDGVLAIGVPNYKSLIVSWKRERWSAWCVKYHIWHFEPKTLRNIFRKHSLSPKKIFKDSDYKKYQGFRKLTYLLIDVINQGDSLIVVFEKHRGSYL
ncbi:MAG TPA: class I SAM-dependent methyltransferase [Candidatus Scalindua sp.]|nr:class I SAM-dependent methyltransferase [Candidatus Scalindua sp.]